MRKGSRLYLRLEQPGCDGFYWHCRKRKKMPIIDLPKAEFMKALWPGKGNTWATVCDISEKARKLSKAGSVEIECGELIVTAYWRIPK